MHVCVHRHTFQHPMKNRYKRYAQNVVEEKVIISIILTSKPLHLYQKVDVSELHSFRWKLNSRSLYFQNPAKSGKKNTAHEGTKYDERSREKLELFLKNFENFTWSVNHVKKSESSCECNVHIVKTKIKAVTFCDE